MDFLADVWVVCDACHGLRFTPETLACTLSGATLADVLAMTASEARALHRGLHPACDLLARIGLDYLQLGQSTGTLSGGERQRLALARELLASPEEGGLHTLHVFDEPTTGLHFDDVDRLLTLFDELIDAGHSVIVIEHNLDVIRAADWIIDLGPEGGERGGTVVAQGTPEEVACSERSHTGRLLSALLRPTSR